MQQAYVAFALVLLQSFLCPCLVISAASGVIRHVGAMQKRDPVNCARSRHDAQYAQEAQASHDFEGLKKQAMQAAKAKHRRGKSSRSAQSDVAWLLESEGVSSVC